MIFLRREQRGESVSGLVPQSSRRGDRSIAPTDGLNQPIIRTSAGIRTRVYRVKACRDNHLHYKEPLDEIAAIVCSLRMIGIMMLPPIAHIVRALCVCRMNRGDTKKLWCGCIPPRGRGVRV